MKQPFWKYKHDFLCLKIIGMIHDARPSSQIYSEIRSLMDFTNLENIRKYDILEERGWITKNGRHIYIGDDGNSSSGMARKAKPDGYIEPMPKKQFRKIKKAFEKQGGIIQQNSETDDFLKKRSVEGITYNSKTVLMTTNPGRACVFEEMIHTHQYKIGKNDGSTHARIICEIEAQKKLLKYSRAYGLTSSEIEQTKIALKNYQNDLNKLGE